MRPNWATLRYRSGHFSRPRSDEQFGRQDGGECPRARGMAGAAAGPPGTTQGGMALMTGLYTLAKLALIAAVVGAVDWLLIGLFEYNFIADIFGSGSQSVTSTGERIIYIAFGCLLYTSPSPRD